MVSAGKVVSVAQTDDLVRPECRDDGAERARGLFSEIGSVQGLIQTGKRVLAGLGSMGIEEWSRRLRSRWMRFTISINSFHLFVVVLAKPKTF